MEITAGQIGLRQLSPGKISAAEIYLPLVPGNLTAPDDGGRSLDIRARTSLVRDAN